MNDILPFSFDDNLVRVIIRDDVPWWVLNDICAILELANPRNASARLHAWQKDDVRIPDAIGRLQLTTVINEPGVYKLILNSRKPEAERFEYWLTAEVLPSIRRTGSYAMHDAAPAPAGILGDVDTTRFSLALSAVSLMRKMRGNGPALALWTSLGLPRPDLTEASDDDLAQRVLMWVADRDSFTNDELAAALGLGVPDASLRRRFGDILRLIGFELRKVRRGRDLVNAWLRSAVELAA